MRVVRVFYIFGFILSVQYTFAQINLIPNSSFEDTVYCPNGPGELEASEGWINPCQFPCIMSPDYYHSCNSVYYSINSNTGNAHVGIFVYDSINFSFHPRDYIQIRLKESLEKSKMYCVEAYFRLSEYCNFATKNIGFFVSDTPVYSTTYNLSYLIPQMEFNSFYITERNVWTKITGKFVASGGEAFITIGNFKNNYETETLYIYSSLGAAYAYYYIDDVSVVLCEDTVTAADTFTLHLPNIFTPNTDGTNDAWQVQATGVQQLSAAVYNRWGTLLWQQEVFADTTQQKTALNLAWNGTSNTSIPVSAGTYFYLVTYTTRQGETKKEKGFITLMR